MYDEVAFRNVDSDIGLVRFNVAEERALLKFNIKVNLKETAVLFPKIYF